MSYEAELDKAQKKLRDIELALNESSIVAITDSKGDIQFANDKFCKISKYSREDLIGRNQSIVNSGYHSRTFFKDMWQTIGKGKVWRGELKNKAKDDTYYWVDTTIVPFTKDNGKPYQYIAIRHDITKRKHYEETIEQMAYYDPLTSLPNRNLLCEWLNNRSKDKEDHITVLFLDIDRFKSINDNFGHHIGDLILKESARRLENCLHQADFILREGGDEFVIFLDGYKNKKDVISITNEILEQFTLPFDVNNRQIITTTSIGITMNTAKEPQGDYLQYVETLIKRADTAMYHAKKQGGNTYCFNTHDQNNEMERYYQIEQEIKLALQQRQFSIVYQPLINLDSNQIIGAEALLRWENPKLGSVAPSEFIPLLEELGLIIPVGDWILKSVCKQLKTWQDNEIFLQKVSVNVSPIQFRNEHFVTDLKQVLEETQLDPQFLELEITEGTIINAGSAMNILTELKDLGVKISIDDFGTGYSSLSYLKKLSIDTLKIDKSFIDDLDSDGEIIVNTIINMGRNLKYTVLAEGIENREQLHYLKHQDCHEGQGYYWSKPVEVDDIPKLYHHSINSLENSLN
ncbi:putative bifunctional diguanylate cyclase/phosphodiesterase [Halobacillus seohaensis]|uniref:Bifunctional diguanylate cyclase/phosphodiesterase n=1 Tax=Halobacillus seohaensis TaxID=447421 RepID=A0ABW2ENF4_9BACI